MKKYVLGIDFGTLSARALVAEIGTGRELAQAEFAYPHGVMTEALPDGTPLPPDWALQHPDDYLLALETAATRALAASGADKSDVVGIGIDFTSCTLIPVDAQGEPLCGKYPSDPHAYPMLWKHHACQKQADRITEIARDRGEAWLGRYGGKVSSEWMLPKILQIIDEAPELYDEAHRFIDAGDWLVMKMTGSAVRNSCMAGYKAFWNKRDGNPTADFLRACHPRLENLAREKLNPVVPVGTRAGGLTAEMAERLALMPGTSVAAANIDAHVSLPAAGITDAGEMLMIMGTSTCHILLGDEERVVPGMCGAVEDGVIPGKIGYEAGQSCVGDHFEWFVRNCMPESYAREAEKRGLNAHEYLTGLAEALKPGESGLIALDWWNGNRSVLVDANLTGLILGMTLQTRPEEIYRALIEATAFGTRVIVDAFEENGVEIHKICACGGIARKNPFIMQLYADVLRREIRVARSAHSSALGSAMFGAVAAGSARGGYDDIREAAAEMGGTQPHVYRPLPRNSAVYDKLYAEYRRLHDYFGRGGSGAMSRLKEIRREQKGE